MPLSYPSRGATGIIQRFNDGAVKTFGYTREEAIGEHLSMIIPLDRGKWRRLSTDQFSTWDMKTMRDKESEAALHPLVRRLLSFCSQVDNELDVSTEPAKEGGWRWEESRLCLMGVS